MALRLTYSKKEALGVAPHFTEPLKPQVIEPKHTATLRCVVSGQPIPVVKWFANNKEVTPNRGYDLSYNPGTGEATLNILKPDDRDQTIFTVQAINSFGRAECRANLIIGEAIKVTKPVVLRAPKITQPINAMIVSTGNPVTLEAKFEGVPAPEVKWYHNGKEINQAESFEIKTTQHKTTLHILEARKPISGKYEVRAVNEVGEARSSGSVTVAELQPEMAEVVPPRFVEPLKPQLVAEGEVVIMETNVYSHPTCSFQWFQQSVPIKSCPEMRIVSLDNRSVLLVNDVLPEHSGIYTCRAENVAGSVTCTATLNIASEATWEETIEFESPRFVKKLATVRVMDGEHVELTCQVSGKPTPKIVWFHKNQPLKEAKDVTVYQDSEGVCKLAIAEVFPEDAGEYTCLAVNKVGKAVCASSLIVEAYEYVPDSEIASVMVGTSLMTEQSGSEEDLLAEKEAHSDVSEEAELPKADIRRGPHFITELLEKVHIRSGELARLEVKVDGHPKPKICWYKQGVEITPSKDFQVEEFEDGIAVLTITEVFPDDAGEILCVAKNEFGSETTVTELVVEGILGTKEYRKPEWVTHMEELQEQLKATQSVPTFVQEIRDSRVKETEPVTFECLFSGVPVPDIVWYKNDVMLRNTKNVQIRIRKNKTTCTILQPTAEDEGVYTCKATSEIGIATTKANLYVQEFTEEERRVFQLKKAQEEEEKIRLEKVKKEKFEKKHKRRGIITFETVGKRETADVHETQILESTAKFVPKKEQVIAEKILTVQDSVEVSAIASCKKVDETKELKKVQEEKAKQILPVQESVTISEIQTEDEVKDLKEREPKRVKEKAKQIVSMKESVHVSEVVSESTTREIQEVRKAETAQKQFLVQESVAISDVRTEEDVEKLKDSKPKWRHAKPEKAPDTTETAIVTQTQAEKEVEKQEAVEVEERQDVKATWRKEKKAAITEKKPQEISLVEEVEVAEELKDKKRQLQTAKPEKTPAVQETATLTETRSEIQEVFQVESQTITEEIQVSKPTWRRPRPEKRAAIVEKKSEDVVEIMSESTLKELPSEKPQFEQVQPQKVLEVQEKATLIQVKAEEVIKETEVVVESESIKEEIQDKRPTWRRTKPKERPITEKKPEEAVVESDVVLEELIDTRPEVAQVKSQLIPNLQETAVVTETKPEKVIEEKEIIIETNTVVEETRPSWRRPKPEKKTTTQEARVVTEETVEKVAEVVEEVIEESQETVPTWRRTKREKKPEIKPERAVEIEEVVKEAVVESKEFEETKPLEKAKPNVPLQEPLVISEIQTEAVVEELQEKRPKWRHAKPELKPSVQETATVAETKSEVVLQQDQVIVEKEVKQQEVIEKKRVTERKKVTIAEEILEKEKTKIATEVEELMDFIQAKEFGSGESPLRDLARIGFLVRRGVNVNEITSLYQADRFPALQTPVAQSALVQLVEREGHGALISEVLTEESTTDEAVVGETVGFRAFMRMVEMKHAAVEEVITHFAPEDFKPQPWESQEVVQVTEQAVSERPEISKEVEVIVQAKHSSSEVLPHHVACTLPFLCNSSKTEPADEEEVFPNQMCCLHNAICVIVAWLNSDFPYSRVLTKCVVC